MPVVSVRWWTPLGRSDVLVASEAEEAGVFAQTALLLLAAEPLLLHLGQLDGLTAELGRRVVEGGVVLQGWSDVLRVRQVDG